MTVGHETQDGLCSRIRMPSYSQMNAAVVNKDNALPFNLQLTVLVGIMPLAGQYCTVEKLALALLYVGRQENEARVAIAKDADVTYHLELKKIIAALAMALRLNSIKAAEKFTQFCNDDIESRS